MTRIGAFLGALLVTTTGTLAAPSARAASLQQVADWGANGVPSDVSMSIYVPDDVADNPPILLLVHYCGGTAQAVFGQAQGGGIVSAADEYGFIMVVPSSGRCWDVVSDRAWTRNGGGDSDAIMQMVQYALETYGANADRVYVTGDSSGGMMTELLLALHPEVFKAGSALAGMPAGCRGAMESGNGDGYSGACAGGSVTHTPEEWGDIARMMNPGYEGHRPRVQLFHGDNDTIIQYPNHTEAIKQWTNVLGLSTDATTTEMGVQLGNHQSTRQTWDNACGFPVLDAFTSLGGDHGPSDALFLAEYMIPFFGLDQTGPVDPEIEQCDDGGGGNDAGGTGGASVGGGGGAAGTGGASDGGASGDGFDAAGAGGSVSMGGGVGLGGSFGIGGSAPVDGSPPMGGMPASGGTPAGGGSPPVGPSPTGAGSTPGPVAPAGSGDSANPASGGGVGGMPSTDLVTSPIEASNSSGCSLDRSRVHERGGLAVAALAVALAMFTRRRRKTDSLG